MEGNNVKRFVLGSLMIAGLAACGQTTTTTTTPAADTQPVVLGFAAVTFTDVNTDHMTVSVKTSSVADGVAGLDSQVLSRPAGVTVAQSNARGAFQGASDRYMYVTLDVSNNTSTAYKNVTLLGYNVPGYNVGDTSLASATRQDGAVVDEAQARTILPINTRVEDPNTGDATISGLKADFQVYSESYIQNITDFMNTRYGAASTAFPFGFVARSSTAKSTSRSIAPGSKTGQVSVAFVAPDSTPLNQGDDVRTFTWYGIITADAVTTASADSLENTLDRACTAVTNFGGSEVHGFDTQTGGALCTKNTVASARIAGDDSAPATAVITH